MRRSTSDTAANAASIAPAAVASDSATASIATQVPSAMRSRRSRRPGVGPVQAGEGMDSTECMGRELNPRASTGYSRAITNHSHSYLATVTRG